MAKGGSGGGVSGGGASGEGLSGGGRDEEGGGQSGSGEGGNGEEGHQQGTEGREDERGNRDDDFSDATIGQAIGPGALPYSLPPVLHLPFTEATLATLPLWWRQQLPMLNLLPSLAVSREEGMWVAEPPLNLSQAIDREEGLMAWLRGASSRPVTYPSAPPSPPQAQVKDHQMAQLEVTVRVGDPVLVGAPSLLPRLPYLVAAVLPAASAIGSPSVPASAVDLLLKRACPEGEARRREWATRARIAASPVHLPECQLHIPPISRAWWWNETTRDRRTSLLGAHGSVELKQVRGGDVLCSVGVVWW